MEELETLHLCYVWEAKSDVNADKKLAIRHHISIAMTVEI